MRCGICEQEVQLGEAVVPTSTGGVAHVRCADLEAVGAWTRRRNWALLHALTVAVVLVALPWVDYAPWLLVLIGAGIAAHPLIHSRVWYYAVLDIRRRLRR